MASDAAKLAGIAQVLVLADRLSPVKLGPKVFVAVEQVREELNAVPGSIASAIEAGSSAGAQVSPEFRAWLSQYLRGLALSARRSEVLVGATSVDTEWAVEEIVAKLAEL